MYRGVIELIRACVDAVGKCLPDLLKMRRSNKLGDLGADLFLLYNHLNEAVICAEDIIACIETYVKRMEGHLQSGNDAYALSGGRWVAYKIEAQQHNLAKVGHSMYRWRRHLQVLDPEAFRELVPLLEGKRNALDALLKSMTHGQSLPLGPSISSVQLLTAGSTTGDADDQASDSRSWFDQDYDRRVRVANEIQRSAVPTGEPWDAEVLMQIKGYLDSDPRRRLDEIKQMLVQLRGALLANFSIEDVLLKVGDERWDVEYDGDSFW